MPSRPGLKWVIIAPTTKGWDGLIIFFNLDQMKSPAGDVSYLTKEYLRFHYDFLKISFDIVGPPGKDFPAFCTVLHSKPCHPLGSLSQMLS